MQKCEWEKIIPAKWIPLIARLIRDQMDDEDLIMHSEEIFAFIADGEWSPRGMHHVEAFIAVPRMESMVMAEMIRVMEAVEHPFAKG